MLDELPETLVFETEYIPEQHKIDKNDKSFEVYINNGVYYVEAEWLAKIMQSINYEDYESLNYFQKVLRTNGIIEKLEEMGINEGDTVSIYDFEFDFIN
jgi:GTP-binding protein